MQALGDGADLLERQAMPGAGLKVFQPLLRNTRHLRKFMELRPALSKLLREELHKFGSTLNGYLRSSFPDPVARRRRSGNRWP